MGADSQVARLIVDDRWTVARGESGHGPFVLRFRQPVLKPPAVVGYPRCIRVVWGYAPGGSRALPTSLEAEGMDTFESRLCTAWERDFVAALVAVLTFDGARQWVFYTSDVPICEARLNEMPQEVTPYPVELDVIDDPDWNYLRNEIIRNRGDA
jgi:hypothetical protein